MSGCGCVQCPRCGRHDRSGTMRCYCGHFFFQMAGSTSPTVPDSNRLVILQERCGSEDIGWFSHNSGHWMSIQQERVNGDPMPKGEWCSVTTGNITGWREILRHNTPDRPPAGSGASGGSDHPTKP